MSKSRKLMELKEKNYSQIKEKVKKKQSRIPLSIIHNTALPNISNIVNRNWNILQINTEFHGVFQAEPMIAFKRSKNVQEIIGGHTVKEGEVFEKSLLKRKRKRKLNGKSLPCNPTRPSL